MQRHGTTSHVRLGMIGSAIASICLALSTANAQGLLTIGSIDTSAFPMMSAKVYISDSLGHRLANLSASSFTVTEQSVQRQVTGLTCSSDPVPLLSTVLVIDVSGSMDTKNDQGVERIDLAKAAARTWIDALPPGLSECAIVSFDDGQYLDQDFTTDRKRLHDAVDAMAPLNGTDYDAALLNAPMGGIPVAARGKYKRVVVILTDGRPNIVPHTAKIINAARAASAVVFAVTLGMPMQQDLQRITEQTGGKAFEDVTTGAEANAVYQQIMGLAGTGTPCTLTWLSEAPCSPQHTDVVIAVPALGIAATDGYDVPVGRLASLVATPSLVQFGAVPVGTTRQAPMTLSANGAAFEVNGISVSDARFSVTPRTFALASGQSQVLTVSYAAGDSGSAMAEFVAHTTTCGMSFYALAGYAGVSPRVRTLRVVRPNGGEVLVAGSDTAIEWTGVPPQDTCAIDYTTDGGATWLPVTDTATGLRFAWHGVPHTPSTACFARIRDFGAGPKDLAVCLGHSRAVNDVEWSPDGKWIATASYDHTARVWNASTGFCRLKLEGHAADVQVVRWSLNGKRLLTASADHTAKIWNAEDGAVVRTLAGHTALLFDAEWSPDNTRILTTSYDGTARIWDAASGDEMLKIDCGARIYQGVWNHSGTQVCLLTGLNAIQVYSVLNGSLLSSRSTNGGYLADVQWSPDGTHIAAAANDSTAIVWWMGYGSAPQVLRGHSGQVNSVCWSADGSKLLTSSYDHTARVWDVQHATTELVLAGHTDWVWNAQWSPDRTKIVTSSADKTARVWDARTGTSLATLVAHTGSVIAARWSPDGAFIATASQDSTARIWGALPEQVDTSDNLWSIVTPSVTGRTIDMGAAVIGTSRDSVVTAAFTNTGAVAMHVDSVVVPDGSTGFGILSGFGPRVIAPGASTSIEVAFTPNTAGAVSGAAVMRFGADSAVAELRGIGVPPALEVAAPLVDFGQIPVAGLRDSTVVLVRNRGPLPVIVTKIVRLGPDTTAFRILGGASAPFVLRGGDSIRLILRFSPKYVGRVNGRIAFEYKGIGSPAVAALFGEGMGALIYVDTNLAVAPPACGRQSSDTSVVLVNTGSTDLTVTRATLSGDDASVFSLLTAVPLTIASGARDSLLVRCTPTSSDQQRATLTIESNAWNTTNGVTRIALIGTRGDVGFSTVSTSVDFGLQPEQTATVRTLQIRDTGATPLTWQTPVASGVFVIDSIVPNPTRPRDSSVVYLRFTGGALGAVFADRLVVNETCGESLALDLAARVRAPGSATIQIGDAAGKPGDVVEVPISLSSGLKLAQSGATQFTTNIRFDASLLYPLPPLPAGIVDGRDRIVPVTLPMAITDTVLTVLRFRAALGRDTTTAMAFDSVVAVGGVVTITPLPGRFTLLGTCRDGGVRLLDGDGRAGLVAVEPNPASDVCVAHIMTSETGRTSLSVYDAFGRRMFAPLDGESSPGAHEVAITTSHLSSGTYCVVLQTPTVTARRMIVVAR